MKLATFLQFRSRARPITASEAGKLGAQVKHDRERERIRAKTNQLRAEMGWPPMEIG